MPIKNSIRRNTFVSTRKYVFKNI
uniref:Uncharacterized protein n=1 Tax=Anguilla anguilla TaxID=7936 RepID=A0A0E9UBM8_ANGAN